MEQKRNRSEVTMQIETNHMRDIKRQRMQKEMMRENDALERKVELEQKAASAKTTFLSSMSHEIRTPIHVVLGLDEMILRESTE